MLDLDPHLQCANAIKFSTFALKNHFIIIAEHWISSFLFCLNRGDSRHFNINDFQDMGRIFGEVLLEYQNAQENKNQQSEIVLGKKLNS